MFIKNIFYILIRIFHKIKIFGNVENRKIGKNITSYINIQMQKCIIRV